MWSDDEDAQRNNNHGRSKSNLWSDSERITEHPNEEDEEDTDEEERKLRE